MPLNLLRWMARRSQQAGNDGEIGKLDYRIGNGTIGQVVAISGTQVVLPVETGDILWDAIAVAGVAVGATAVQLTAEQAASVHQYAMVTVENVDVRFFLNGTAPTSTVGHLLKANDTLVIDGTAAVDNAQFISATGATSTLQVSYGNRSLA